jgi:arylsulfatase A-like enzyme
MQPYIFLLSLMILLCGCQPNKVSDKKLPNIVVVLADDAGYADFGFMGSDDLLTPHLDLLAESGVIFTDAHTSASVCAPSRAGLMSGQYQQRFGFECNDIPQDLGLSIKEETMASALKPKGYHTVAIGKWHLGLSDPYHPNERGFDEFYGFLSGARSYFSNKRDDQEGHPNAMLYNHKRIDFSGYLTDALGDHAVDYIERHKSEPFFMYLSFNAVHTPMEAKEEDLKKFEGHPRQQLAAMTWSMDENIGKVMTKLQTEGLAENTLIFFLSDNGGAANNQSDCGPLKGWKGNKFEGGHRVPFLVSWNRKIPSGQTFDGLTSALDIFATAAAVAEVDLPKLDGVNLIPFLTQEENGSPHHQLFWRKDKMAAGRIGLHKLIRLDDYGYRFYNLTNDIGETHDQQEDMNKDFSHAQHQLDQWEARLIAPHWTENPSWDTVTYEIHQALMENRAPHYTDPKQLRDYLLSQN